MITCDICERQFKTQQGLIGHRRFKHGIKTNPQLPLDPPKHFITDETLYLCLNQLLDTVVELVKFRNEQYEFNKVTIDFSKKIAERLSQ